MSLHETLAQAIHEVGKARALVLKYKGLQVRGTDERDLLRSVGYTWFKSHRPLIQHQVATAEALTNVDDAYRGVLDASEKASARTTYLDALKSAKESLIALRAEIVAAPNPRKLTRIHQTSVPSHLIN